MAHRIQPLVHLIQLLPDGGLQLLRLLVLPAGKHKYSTSTVQVQYKYRTSTVQVQYKCRTNTSCLLKPEPRSGAGNLGGSQSEREGVDALLDFQKNLVHLLALVRVVQLELLRVRLEGVQVRPSPNLENGHHPWHPAQLESHRMIIMIITCRSFWFSLIFAVTVLSVEPFRPWKKYLQNGVSKGQPCSVTLSPSEQLAESPGGNELVEQILNKIQQLRK